MKPTIATKFTNELKQALILHEAITGDTLGGYGWENYIPVGYVEFAVTENSFRLISFTTDLSQVLEVSNKVFLSMLEEQVDYIEIEKQEKLKHQLEAYTTIATRISELNDKDFNIDNDPKYTFYYVENNLYLDVWYHSTYSPTSLIMSSQEVAEQVMRELPKELDILFNPNHKF